MRTQTGAWVAAAALALALLLSSLFVGSYDIFNDDFGSEMFWITRVPRTLTLMLAGAALATSGLVMQMLTQNRFVDATTSGTTEWAALGLLCAAIFWPTGGLFSKMVLASVAAFIGAIVFFMILRRIRLRTVLIVPVVGLMLGAIVSSLTLFIAAETNLLQMVGTWFLGSVGEVVRGRYELLWVVGIMTVIICFMADRLTIAGLGEEVATSVGMRYETMLLGGAALVAISAGVTTSVVGYLPLVGLVVPNIVARFRGDDVRGSLPWVIWGGVVLVTASDVLGRLIAAPFEMPVSLVLGIVGAVVCTVLLVQQPKVSVR